MKCRGFLFAVVILIALNTANAEDRRTDLSHLSIMTLNAEFLWDGVEPEEGVVNFSWKGSQGEAEEHMHKVAEIVVKSNPDIVNLVEVENEHALSTFIDMFLSGRGYKGYFIQGKDTYTGQDVVLITRIDPEEGGITRDNRKGQSGQTSKSVSKNYIAKMVIGDRRIALVGIHLLAQPNREDRRLDREAQAQAMHAVAMELRSIGYEPIILGDFNDYDSDLKCLDHKSSLPITNVLRILKSMDDSNPDDDLICAASFVPQEKRYTAFYDANDNGKVDPPNEYTSIDHILLPASLAAKVDVVEIPHDHNPLDGTDHFPIVVRLKMEEVVPPSISVKIRIVSLLPNPAGNETENEEVTIKNLGTDSIIMNGWKLKDLSGKTWMLDSLDILKKDEQKTIMRRGQPMTLNNDGDTIDLINTAGQIVQTVTYPRMEEGEVFSPVVD